MNFTPNTISMDQIGIPRNSNNIQLSVIGNFSHMNSDLNLKNIPSLLNQGKVFRKLVEHLIHLYRCLL